MILECAKMRENLPQAVKVDPRNPTSRDKRNFCHFCVLKFLSSTAFSNIIKKSAKKPETSEKITKIDLFLEENLNKIAVWQSVKLHFQWTQFVPRLIFARFWHKIFLFCAVFGIFVLYNVVANKKSCKLTPKLS